MTAPRTALSQRKARRRTSRVLSDRHLGVSEIDVDAPRSRRWNTYPDVPLIVVDGALEPAPSWWLLELAQRRAPPDTLETYAKGIELWCGALHRNGIPWHRASAVAVQGFIDALLRRGNSENAVAVRAAAVLAFYGWAVRRGLLRGPRFERGDLKIPKGTSRSVRAHPPDEFGAIVAELPRLGPGECRRDELIGESGRFLGLRRKEVAGLRETDFSTLDPDRALNVIWTNPAYTKRGKSRPVLVPSLFVAKVQNFIKAYRGEAVRRLKRPGWTPPPNLFLTNRGTPVTGDYITDTWKRAARAARIDSRFHNNRSSYATHVSDAAMELGMLPLPIVMDLLRHAQESTSRRYVDYAELRSRLLIDAHIINDNYAKEAAPR